MTAFDVTPFSRDRPGVVRPSPLPQSAPGARQVASFFEHAILFYSFFREKQFLCLHLFFAFERNSFFREKQQVSFLFYLKNTHEWASNQGPRALEKRLTESVRCASRRRLHRTGLLRTGIYLTLGPRTYKTCESCFKRNANRYCGGAGELRARRRPPLHQRPPRRGGHAARHGARRGPIDARQSLPRGLSLSLSASTLRTVFFFSRLEGHFCF